MQEKLLKITSTIIFSMLLFSFYAQKVEVAAPKEATFITQELLSNPSTRPYLKDPKKYALHRAKAIIVHGTANQHKTANALFHKKYFNGGTKKASAHYVADDCSAIQCVPNHEVAYHGGGLRYTELGRMLSEDRSSPNYYTIGIEMCVNEGSNFEQTKINTFQVIHELWKAYGYLPLYRHADLTGKPCPKVPVNGELQFMDDAEWEIFKQQAADFHAAKYLN